MYGTNTYLYVCVQFTHLGAARDWFPGNQLNATADLFQVNYY